MIVKKGDTVIVLSGRDRGKQGTIEKAMPAESKVVVAGVNIRKRHLKPSKNQPKGGIVEFAAPLPLSTVMLVCSHCSKPTRSKVVVQEDGTKARVCRHCQSNLDSK